VIWLPPVTATAESGTGELRQVAQLTRVHALTIGTVLLVGVVVVLHYLNGLNLAEIAQVVDCPVGTVKSRLHYALRRLRTHLSAHPELGIEPTSLLAPSSRQTVAPVVEPMPGEPR